MKKTENKKLFDAISLNYIREDSHWGSDLDLIKNSLERIAGTQGSWLDLGCGPGFHISFLAQIFPEIDITGQDYSKEMISIAEKKLREGQALNVKLFQGDVLKRLPRSQYNLITFLNNGFGNIYDPREKPEETRTNLLRRLKEKLSPEGEIILSIYNKETYEPIYGKNLRLTENSNTEEGNLFVEYIPPKGEKIIYYSHWFTQDEIENLAKTSGMKIDFMERRMSRYLTRFRNLSA